MALFGKKLNEKEAETPCCREEQNPAGTAKHSGCGNGGGSRSVKVLGSGCKACHQLYDNAVKAVEDMGIEVEYITDLQRIMEYGALSMPALVVDEKLVSSGKVLKPAEIARLIAEQ